MRSIMGGKNGRANRIYFGARLARGGGAPIDCVSFAARDWRNRCAMPLRPWRRSKCQPLATKPTLDAPARIGARAKNTKRVGGTP
jgi:hypothetical protein